MEFIGCDARIDQGDTRHNFGRIVRSHHLASVRRSVTTKRVFYRLPLSWRTALDDLYLTVNSKPGGVQMPAEIKAQLLDIYADDVADL